MQKNNLAHMFFDHEKIRPQSEAYRFKKEGSWISLTFSEAVQQSLEVAAAFAALGIQPGERLAIMSNNRIEWALIDYAVLALGAVLVPVYPTLSQQHVHYILTDASVKIFIVENRDIADQTEKMCNELNDLHTRVLIDPDGSASDPWLTYESLLQIGKNFLSRHPGFVYQRMEQVEPNQTATIIYTSGTTGEPKGVILSHKNILSNLVAASKIFEFFPSDLFLSFLPLSHVFERTIGHYLSCYHGLPVAYAESLDKIAQNVQEVKPTLMIAVPRLFEKMHARIIEQVESSGLIKKKIFNSALRIGSQVMLKKMKGQPVPVLLKGLYRLFHILVYQKLRTRLGGKIRFMVSGGAPLPRDIAEFFDAAGLRILEGYGLTETSPAVAINRLDTFKYGTVGQPLPNVQVRIAADGEILVKGDLIMSGYLNKQAETEQVIDGDGWFCTGDIGFLDEQGFLTITDRKKNIIVTSGGKNIAPVPIEQALLKSRYIEQALLIGDKRNFCTALIVPERTTVLNYIQTYKIQGNGFEDQLKQPEIKELFRTEIEKLTSFASRYETIKDFCLIAEPFTQENGQLTPTLKIRRNVVEEIYGKEIEEMYH